MQGCLLNDLVAAANIKGAVGDGIAIGDLNGRIIENTGTIEGWGTRDATRRTAGIAIGSRANDGTTVMAASVLSVANLVGGDALSQTDAGSVAIRNVLSAPQTLTHTGLALGGSSASNYMLTGGAGTATITMRPLIVTAEDAGRLQGQRNPVFTVRTTGLVAGDTPGVIRGLELVSPATATSRLGAYPITPIGGSAADYTLVRMDGTLTVEPSAESTQGEPIVASRNVPPASA